ncbi:MAG: hypothetical protein ACRCZE_01560 [Candidatus Altimarinota bacterium]
MSTKDPNNLVDLGEEQGFSALGDRLTFNPAAEESTGDSASKKISKAVELKVAAVLDEATKSFEDEEEEDDENVTTGVLEWPGAGVEMPTIPVTAAKPAEKDEYEIVNDGEFDIDDLPSAERHEVELDEQFHQLENSNIAQKEVGGEQFPVMYEEDDFGPSAKIYNVLEGKFLSDIPSAPSASLTIAPAAPNLTVVPLAYTEDKSFKFYDEDITINLEGYQEMLCDFAESKHAKNYIKAQKYYESNKGSKIIKEPLRPPMIEEYLVKFAEEKAKKAEIAKKADEIAEQISKKQAKALKKTGFKL